MNSIRFALSICALAFAGCATNPKPATATACTTPAACDESPYKLARLDPVPPRDDCPPGYAFVSNSAGTACWPKDRQTPPAGCVPSRCPDSGYLLWDCPTPKTITPPADTPDNIDLRLAVQERCYWLAVRFRLRLSFSAYETMRSCLQELRTLVSEDDRQLIDQKLREYDERIKNSGHPPPLQ